MEVIVFDDNGKVTKEQLETQKTIKEFLSLNNFKNITQVVSECKENGYKPEFSFCDPAFMQNLGFRV